MIAKREAGSACSFLLVHRNHQFDFAYLKLTGFIESWNAPLLKGGVWYKLEKSVLSDRRLRREKMKETDVKCDREQDFVL